MTIPVMGCDAHLDTVAVAVVDETGRELAGLVVANRGQGWDETVRLCERFRIATVGIEGASGYGHGLAVTLHRRGVTVKDMPTRLTARTRRVDGAGKSDPGDARTIARAAIRGEGHQWIEDPPLETIRLLNRRRESLVAAQTQAINQLRALLAEVDPETASRQGRLRSRKAFDRLRAVSYQGDRYRETVTELIRQLAQECQERSDQLRRLERRLQQEMPPVGQALQQIQGCGVIVAAQLLSQIAGTAGFKTDAQMASWAGTAPLDASSGRQQRHRLNRGGNRQTNRALHTIIITQIQHQGPAHHYLTRRIRQGKTRKEAIRAAKRHLTRRIWTILHNHQLT